MFETNNFLMEFSVLLSLYYKEKCEYLKQSLDSIFNQTVKPTEVILVEDGPLTTELYTVVDEYSRNHKELKVIPLKKNEGLGNALNQGLKYCSYELVARMDSDDIAKPNRFECQIKIFEENPKIDVCGSWIDEFTGNPNIIQSQRLVPEYNDEIIKYAHSRCPINHPTVMYKKSKILSVGGYSGFPEDYYLWVKLMMSNACFYNIQKSLLLFRFSSDVIKRRGGFVYAKDCFKTQYSFYKVGFISFAEFIVNCFIRCSVSIMPNCIRSIIYRKYLRKS